MTRINQSHAIRSHQVHTSENPTVRRNNRNVPAHHVDARRSTQNLTRLESNARSHVDIGEVDLDDLDLQLNDIDSEWDDDSEISENRHTPRHTESRRAAHSRSSVENVERAEREAEQRAEWVEEFKGDIRGFKQELNTLKSNHKLTTQEVNTFKTKADTIAKDLEEGRIDLRRAKTKLEGLTDEVNTKLRSDFDSKKAEKEALKNKILLGMDLVVNMQGGWAHEKAAQLATLIKSAIRNNSWSAVESTLNSFPKNDANNIVQYIVGGIYKQCGKNEAELMKALELIPQNVREKMVQKVTEDAGELNSRENTHGTYEQGVAGALSGNPDIFLTFWTPTQTAELISRSSGQETAQNTQEEEVPQIGNSSSDE